MPNPKWYYRDVLLVSTDIIKPVPGKTRLVTQSSEDRLPRSHVLNSSVMETSVTGVLRLQITLDWTVHEFHLDGRIPKRVKFVDILRTPEERKQPTYLQDQWQFAGDGWRHVFKRGLQYSPEGDPDLE